MNIIKKGLLLTSIVLTGCETHQEAGFAFGMFILGMGTFIGLIRVLKILTKSK